MRRFRAYPIGRHYANELIVRWHRHHGPVVGFKAAWVALEGEHRFGVVVLGRAVARGLGAGAWEITRNATDGTEHGCSFLYSVACREAKRQGAERVYTYILASESGVSLKAAGFRFDGFVRGRSWSCPSRLRTDKHPIVDKQRWVRDL